MLIFVIFLYQLKDKLLNSVRFFKIDSEKPLNAGFFKQTDYLLNNYSFRHSDSETTCAD